MNGKRDLCQGQAWTGIIEIKGAESLGVAECRLLLVSDVNLY